MMRVKGTVDIYHGHPALPAINWPSHARYLRLGPAECRAARIAVSSFGWWLRGQVVWPARCGNRGLTLNRCFMTSPTSAPDTFPPQELLEALTDISLTGVVLYTPVFGPAQVVVDFAFAYLNPAAQRMLMLPAKVTHTYRQQFTKTHDNGSFAFHRDTFLSGRPGRYELNYQSDGYDNSFRVAGQRVGAGLLVSFTDTADQPRTAVETALRESQAREMVARAEVETQRGELHRIFEQAPAAVAVLRGPCFVVEWANPAMCAMWGRAPAQVQGMPVFELLPEAAGQGFEELLNGVLATGVAHVAHELPSFIDRGGQRVIVYWNFVYNPLREPDGRITGITVVATDVTEQVLARQQILRLNAELARSVEQLRSSNAELEQKVADRTNALLITLHQLERRGHDLAQALTAEQELGELKSRFVSMASHEFRTPLTVVLTSAELIEDYTTTAQQGQRLKHVERIRGAVTNLNNILEEFLSVGRIEEGKVESHPANLDLAVLVAETTADVQALLKTGQRIDWQVQCPNPMWLDDSLLRKVLVNLLSNALKYSAEGAVVTVGATCNDHQLTLVVQDRGVGISEEDQAHLFERFFRARSVSTIQGTGLGLYIIACYLKLMGGTIALHSMPEQGTTVTLTLPYENHSAH